ncbi:class II aldolase/adducin family protein [Bdellovibrio sp. HCB337]|uniref:class II aldolase/adducin family protein n=1 Tax=Bdellovibrio sp. HCB337 TaxID=3394358 RepID=UPI0039A6FDAC
MTTPREISEQIVEVARRLHERNMLAAADGNISFRISDQEILITPSGIAKAFMKPQEMALITLDNNVLAGKPSGERLMHLEIYKQCPQAKAVIHAHPPTAIAWSIARPDLKELPADSLSEVILATGRIPFVPYARPGTLDMGTHMTPFLPKHRALILSRHGAVAWGEDLDEAYRGMERIEHSALILAKAVQLGGLTSLPAEEVAVLHKMRAELGDRLL